MTSRESHMNWVGRAPRRGVRGWQRLPLRSRIALIAAAAVAVSVVGVSIVVFLVTGVQLRQQVDDQLLTDAHTVAAKHAAYWSPGSGADHDRDHDHDVGPRVQVLDGTGRPVLNPGETAVLPVTAAARRVATGACASAAAGRCDPVFEDVDVGGEGYRMLTLAAAPAGGQHAGGQGAGGQAGGAVQVAVGTEGVDRPLARIGLVLVLVSACGVAVAAGLGYVVARTGLGPVHRLTGAVEHVAATQDLDARIEVAGRDEIARLAHSFNGMLAALRSSRDAQRLLVDDAGHELRTPLTSLRTNVELLLRAERQGRRLTPEDRAALLRDLDAQTTELADLVGELVDLARGEGTTEPMERVDLAELVDLVVQRIALRHPGLVFATDLAPVVFPGHPASLDRMVANLVDNAAKWSPPSGTVRITLRTATDPAAWRPGSGNVAELTVADEGPGIADEDLPRIFERFYRAPATRSLPGSGLGLAIVAQAVDLHAGTVQAGRAPAGGALFTVRLPLSRDS